MELKRCPFCGSEADIRYRKATHDYVPECSNWLCIASYVLGNSFYTEEKAIDAWNTRKHEN